jgi:hypothetical protein
VSDVCDNCKEKKLPCGEMLPGSMSPEPGSMSPEEEGLEETLDPSPKVSEAEESFFRYPALPPCKGVEFEDPHQPWDAKQYWKGKMDQNSQWEGEVVPFDVIKRRYQLERTPRWGNTWTGSRGL